MDYVSTWQRTNNKDETIIGENFVLGENIHVYKGKDSKGCDSEWCGETRNKGNGIVNMRRGAGGGEGAL